MKTFLSLALFVLLAAVRTSAAPAYHELITKDQAVSHWSFDTLPAGQVTGAVTLGAGPQPPLFPHFSRGNQAALFPGRAASVRIPDAGDNSPFDFARGDTVTLEAWVLCRSIKEGQQVYIVGKGRTQNRGFAPHNQNWALRLRGRGDLACVSFLFRDERNRPDKGDEDWHRWTSEMGLKPGDGWHHVAVSYTFGKGDSIKGFIDGVETGGVWDMGGQTDLGPVVDNDEVWV
ncbi:MAG: LamG domain-containing protein, partial [Verrucomicrobiota bacterium]|nr:LamG domain-containing protein [Verrucomicrobiota bacterium]